MNKETISWDKFNQLFLQRMKRDNNYGVVMQHIWKFTTNNKFFNLMGLHQLPQFRKFSFFKIFLWLAQTTKTFCSFLCSCESRSAVGLGHGNISTQKFITQTFPHTKISQIMVQQAKESTTCY